MGCVRPHVATIVGAVLIFISLVFQVVGLSAPGWFFVRIGEQGDAMVGLWEFCHSEPKFDCKDFSEHWKVESWLEATRAFSILGMLALMVSSVSAVMMCVLSQIKVFSTIAPASSLAAALIIFTEFSVLAGVVERRKNTIGQDFEYRYCFGLTISAFILSLCASLLICCGNSRQSDEDGDRIMQ